MAKLDFNPADPKYQAGAIKIDPKDFKNEKTVIQNCKVYRLYAMGGEWEDSYEHTIGIFSSKENAIKALDNCTKGDWDELKETYPHNPIITHAWECFTKHTGLYGDGEILTIEEWEIDKE